MKQFLAKSILLVALITCCHWAAAERPATLPGGLVFPTFSMASLVNSASMAFDWRTEFRTLYSPPLSDQDPHSYLGSLSYSNGRAALNMGYTGSYQEGTAFNSLFGGGAFRLGRIALGASIRKTELASDVPLQLDFSGILRINSRIRLGASAYNVNGEQQLGLGIGLGKPLDLTLEGDILFPMKPQGNGMSDQYSLNAVLTSYLDRLAYSLGVRYNRQQDGFNNEGQIIASIGLNYRLTRSLNLTSQYQSNPQSIGIGLVWVWTPPADQYIKVFQQKNKKTIWD